MKTKFSLQKQRGSAVLVVLVLLGLMAALMLSNTNTLNSLKANLRLIEHKQLKQSIAPSPGIITTNALTQNK